MARQQHQWVVLALVLAMAVGGHAQATQNTLQDAKNTGTCTTNFRALLTRFYSNDPVCRDLITQAMNVTVKAQCPGVTPLQPGSNVHLCMNKNNTLVVGGQNVLDAWSTWVQSCEVMYIANRGGASESEEGFTYVDNSCFPIFNSFADFRAWLFNTAVYGAAQVQMGGSSALRLAMGTMVAAISLALAAILA